MCAPVRNPNDPIGSSLSPLNPGLIFALLPLPELRGCHPFPFFKGVVECGNVIESRFIRHRRHLPMAKGGIQKNDFCSLNPFQVHIVRKTYSQMVIEYLR